MKRDLLWFAAAVALVVAVAPFVLRSGGPATRAGEPAVGRAPGPTSAPAEVVPVVRLDSRTEMAIEYDFENTSDKPIGYMPGNRPDDVWLLDFLLYRDGKYVQSSLPNGEPPVLARDRVRTLAPGAKVTRVRRLDEEYRDLRPGRYEVRLRYAAGGDLAAYGITPTSFERKLMYIEIK
jgi:hypothetical protein